MAENAKKTEKQSQAELQIIQSTDELIQIATEDLLSNTIQSDQDFNQMLETFQGFFIDGIEDMVSYDAVKDASKKLKTLRINIDKHRKTLTAPAVKWQKDLKKVADEYINKISPMEDQLNKQLKVVDDKKAAAEEALFSERAQLLAAAGYQLAGNIYVMGVLQVPVGKLISLTEEELEFYLDEAEKEQQRVAARDKEYQDKLDALNQKEQELADREAKLAKAEEPDPKPAADIDPEPEPIVNAEEPDPAPFPAQDDGVDVPFSPAPSLEAEADKEYTEAAWDATYQQGYREGFANMQMRIVELLSGEQKFTRAQILQWVNTQEVKLESHVDQ